MNHSWYVWKIGGGPPTHPHLTEELAVEEAKRLVDYVGGEYVILEAIKLVRATPRHIVEYLPWTPMQPDPNPIEDSIPF